MFTTPLRSEGADRDTSPAEAADAARDGVRPEPHGDEPDQDRHDR
jgi:hypothetical protein